MRKYAEIYNGFVIGKPERTDKRVPEFEPPRFAIRIDDLAGEPAIGDEHFGGTNFGAPTRPNPNLAPPPETNREILEETRELVQQVLALLPPRP